VRWKPPGKWARGLAGAAKKRLLGGLPEMMLVDLGSVVMGSAIIVGLFASIAVRKSKRITTLNKNWQKIEVMV